MKLKIGILGCRGIPNAYGGFEQFAEKLAVKLVERGHQVSVYNSSLHPYKKKEWNGVTIIHCADWEDKLEAAGQFIYDWNCINDSRKRNFHILLQLGYTSNSVWHWRWPKDSINIVNMDGLEWKRTQYSKLVRLFIKKAEALAAKHTDYMVADSTGIQQYILDTYNKTSSFIPYGAEIFNQPDSSLLNKFQLKPYSYYLVVSRLEPENNVEMIIKGFLNSKKNCKLVIVGGINKFGKIWKDKYRHPEINFIAGVFDKNLLNNLRFFSKLHFHGHSVGGTNPSLLEAMACQCNIVAHENIFNKSILGNDADYFSNHEEISAIINAEWYQSGSMIKKENNLVKIRQKYNWEVITDAYESLMFEAFLAKANNKILSATHQIA